jgi:anaerobic glycerol-3-phosphate dehydrogenase
MDDARRKAAEVLAAMTVAIYGELTQLVDAERSAVNAGKGDVDALANLESALDNAHGAMDAMREAAKPAGDLSSSG